MYSQEGFQKFINAVFSFPPPPASHSPQLQKYCGSHIWFVLQNNLKNINYEWEEVFCIDLELVLNYPMITQLLEVQERYPEMLPVIPEN